MRLELLRDAIAILALVVAFVALVALCLALTMPRF